MWPFRRRAKPRGGNGNGGAAARAAAESQAKKRAAERMTPFYEEFAQHLASLPPEEFMDRVSRMFGRHA